MTDNRDKITLSIELGRENFHMEIALDDWRHGDNPLFIAKEFTEATHELMARIEEQLITAFGDVRATSPSVHTAS